LIGSQLPLEIIKFIYESSASTICSLDKKYNFDQADLILEIGDQVIVKTELGMELAKWWFYRFAGFGGW